MSRNFQTNTNITSSKTLPSVSQPCEITITALTNKILQDELDELKQENLKNRIFGGELKNGKF